MSYTIWDVETTIKESFKRKANPFDPDNYVVMSGWKRPDGLVVGDYFGRRGAKGGTGLPDDWFIKLLTNSRVIVGANIKFDLLHALVRNPTNHLAWMDWVAAGGSVWDIQLAEYLLSGMDPADHMLSLDELAPRYGGNVKFDEVKVLWQAGISTEDINPDLLRRYLCGTEDEHGDIGNTELVFLGQLARARACGQLKSIYMNMGSLLCTTEMELNGMAVNKELGLKLAADLELEIAKLAVELAGYLPADLPFDFNWNSAQQKSAIIFGGKVKYEARVFQQDANGQQLYAQMDERHITYADGTTGSLEVYMGLTESEQANVDRLCGPVRYKAGKNAGELKTKLVKVDDPSKPKSRMEDFYWEFPRLIEPKNKWKGAVDGVWSTASEVIAELGGKGIPFLEALAKVSGLTKDLTTYYITDDPKKPGEKKGMLTLVQADGIIHHMLNHTSTVTARFSSSNPNLQNLPKEGKSVAKAMFISRFGVDGKIIQSDFSSLEVFVQAILTKCKQLIVDLIQGLDMHCVRVSQAEGISYEEAVKLCKGYTDSDGNKVPADPVWAKKRGSAKVFSFQRAYGAGAALIAESTGMPREDVDALILAEAERYPEIEPWYADLTLTIKHNRLPSGKWFDHPDIVGLKCNPGKSSYRTPDGKLYSWRENAAPEFLARKGTPTTFSPTEIKNYPVQGTGGEWAKAAMWLAVRAFYATRNFDGFALLVNQVHDAIYVDSRQDKALAAAALLHACMEEASTFMEYYFDWPIPVPVPSETTWGANMMDEQRMPEGFKELVLEQRKAIRSRFINNHEASFELAA